MTPHIILRVLGRSVRGLISKGVKSSKCFVGLVLHLILFAISG